MNIYQRINEVRKAVDYAKKDKKVEGYMAVTHDQITALTREHFVKHGIVIVPSLVASAVVPTGTMTAKGTPFVRYEATYDFAVVNADDPADKFSARIEAHAIDHGDKAPGKALSYAKKSFVLKVLEIESGVDDESRDEQKPQKNEDKQSHSPTDGAFKALAPELQIRAKTVAKSVVDLWADEKPVAAYEQVYASGHDGEFILGVWELLRPHSEIRTAIKKMRKEDSQTSTSH